MLNKLLLIFVLFPLIDGILLFKIKDWLAISMGDDLALMTTLGAAVLTGVIGWALAKREGLSILRKIQTQMANGEMPGQQLADGAIILVCGALLVTPGVITDILGLAGLIPFTRKWYRMWLIERFKRGIASGKVNVNIRYQGTTMHQQQKPPRQDDVIDVTPDSKTEGV